MFDKIEAGGGEPPTKQFFIPINYGILMTFYGSYTVARLGDLNDDASTNFYVPDDFHSITEAYIVVIPRSTQAAAEWTISSNYSAVGEGFSTHAELDAVSTYNVTDDQTFEVDISGILTSLAAGDYVGIAIVLGNAAHDVDVLGVMLKYD